MELTKLRAQIDELDDQLVDRLCERMDLSTAVAAYKAAHHLPVLAAGREAEVLDKVRARVQATRPDADGYPEAAAQVFAAMMDTSRALQHRRMGAGATLRGKIDDACRRPLITGQTRVVCAGSPGAYAHKAAVTMFPFCAGEGRQPRFVPTFADVVAAVRDGQAEYGILPVENSSTGSVNEVFDLILTHRYCIVAATTVAVRHCLMARPDAGTITDVYSHHQALSQCGEYLAARGLTAHGYPNTATAAQMVAESEKKHIAAIASEEAARLYGLTVLDRDIQSVEHNVTRFIAISKTDIIPPGADKISVIFSLPHVTGSLYRILAQFAIEGLNLTKLESRPVKNGAFEYAFYLDFEGSVEREATKELLCSLSDELPQFCLLGNYKEI
ncbi:MAG: prephenate dehydratase [Acutalibacteraceae bacterium]|jgi:chorismate mutase/prephenate dehydratase